MKPTTFPLLILNARPGAGKSEIIEYLKSVPLEERMQRFHINQMKVFDDFPILWSWFEEDDLLEKMGYPRLHTTADRYFTGQHLWNLLIQRLCQLYEKQVRDNHEYHKAHTAIIEFSRGTQHGGYQTAYQFLSPKVLESAAILYIKVSWEESVRKNRKRYNPAKPDSILEHGLEDDKMKRLYRYDDWFSLDGQNPEFLSINSYQVPTAVFDNEDDYTSQKDKILGPKLQQAFDILWKRYLAMHPLS